MKLKATLGTVLGVITGLCLGCGSLQAQDDIGGPGGPPPGESGNGGAGGPGENGDSGGNHGPGGNFDPAQFQQHLLDQARKNLNLTNEDEWAAIQPLIKKVLDARREVGGGGPVRPGAQADSEEQVLQKAVDESVPVAQLKSALAKYRALRKEKQARLEAAQADLQNVLSVKQEAQAVLLRLLN